MNPGEVLHFAPFRIELSKRQLWRGEEKVALRPMSVLVLAYLVSRAGEVVQTEEVLQAVWGKTHVTRGVLPVCVREIRQALGDEVAAPRYIETIGREGYRFIGEAVSSQQSVVSRSKSDPAPNPQPPAPILVGRDTELAQLHGWLAQALNGTRQVVFVTGEAGIGKTTVVQHFLQQAQAAGALWVRQGQCIEHYGVGEAYLPVLEALGRVGRQAGRAYVLEVLRRQAPSWLVQMPALLEAGEGEALRRAVQGVARERMLRELAEALEGLAVERPVVLVLEDLHWSDGSTVELLAFLARRAERARLLVMGTYRLAEVVTKGHPLQGVKQELQAHGLCEELALDLLTKEEVRTYLEQRLAGSPIPAELNRVVHQRTDGNALFMVDFVEYLLQQRFVVEEQGRWVFPQGLAALEIGVPDNLQQLVIRQIEELQPEAQQVLEAASVTGMVFTTEVVAAGIGSTVQEVEAVCEGLARREQFLAERGLEEWPDGTLTASYEFHHAFYQQVLYGRLGTLQRVRLHRLVGERKETGYGKQAAEIAAELAVHFEQGRVPERAVQYHQHAGEQALRRNAYYEAKSHFTAGLDSLKTLPESAEHRHREFLLQIALGRVLRVIQGSASAEAELAYARARALAEQSGDRFQQFLALQGLWLSSEMKGTLQRARALGEELLELARQIQDPALFFIAHSALGDTLYFLGEFVLAQTQLEQARSYVKPGQHSFPDAPAGRKFVGIVPAYLAFVLWMLGYPDQACSRMGEARALAQEAPSLYDVASVLLWDTVLQQLLQQQMIVHEQGERLLQLSTTQGFPQWVAFGRLLQGWTLVGQGHPEQGLAQLRHGVAAFQASGAQLPLTYFFGVSADACRMLGQGSEGLGVVADALAMAEQTGERFYEAELWRLKGELTLQQSRARLRPVTNKSKTSRGKSADTNLQSPTPNPHSEAEACFHKAIEVARLQEAKALELRATMSLAHLWQQQGKHHEARNKLSDIYKWFTEGFDTADLREAKALLEQLACSNMLGGLDAN